jgi:hypothetical protein
MADRGLAVDPHRMRVQALKGVLLLLSAKSRHIETSEAEALLEKSIEANKNLKHEFQAYLDEAQSMRAVVARRIR